MATLCYKENNLCCILNPKDDEFNFIQFIARGTPKNQLFLHELSTHNIHDNTSDVSDVEAVISWFADTLKIIYPDMPYKQGVVLKAANDYDLRSVFKALLSFFDTGIDDIYLEEVPYIGRAPVPIADWRT